MKSVSSGVAARLLGVSRESISRYCKQGHFKFHLTPGGQLRIQYDSIMQFLNPPTATPSNK